MERRYNEKNESSVVKNVMRRLVTRGARRKKKRLPRARMGAEGAGREFGIFMIHYPRTASDFQEADPA